jgi:hypothetical protein
MSRDTQPLPNPYPRYAPWHRVEVMVVVARTYGHGWVMHCQSSLLEAAGRRALAGLPNVGQ